MKHQGRDCDIRQAERKNATKILKLIEEKDVDDCMEQNYRKNEIQNCL